MRDSYGTYDGSKPEPPYECPECGELQAKLQAAKEAHKLMVTDLNIYAEREQRLRAENDRLREALDGVMEGQVYSCIMGEWYWHQRTVPSLESLDKARAALETKP